MVTAVWSMKGGVGVSSVACMLALGQSERAEPTTLLDLEGDVPALLGMEDGDQPGLADWLATPSQSAGTLARISQEVKPDLHVILRGSGGLDHHAAPLLQALPSIARATVVDCGMLTTRVAVELAESADQRLVVARPCYLTLRVMRSTPVAPTGVIMLKEPGRALGRCDVESVLGAPVLAQIAVDPVVARALDAGLLASRLPRSLVRTMAGAAR